MGKEGPVTTKAGGNTNSNSRSNIKNNKRLCKFFQSTKGCNFGSKCRYSHDISTPKNIEETTANQDETPPPIEPVNVDGNNTCQRVESSHLPAEKANCIKCSKSSAARKELKDKALLAQKHLSEMNLMMAKVQMQYALAQSTLDGMQSILAIMDSTEDDTDSKGGSPEKDNFVQQVDNESRDVQVAEDSMKRTKTEIPTKPQPVVKPTKPPRVLQTLTNICPKKDLKAKEPKENVKCNENEEKHVTIKTSTADQMQEGYDGRCATDVKDKSNCLDDIISNVSAPYITVSPQEYISSLRAELDVETAQDLVEVINDCLDVLALKKACKATDEDSRFIQAVIGVGGVAKGIEEEFCRALLSAVSIITEDETRGGRKSSRVDDCSNTSLILADYASMDLKKSSIGKEKVVHKKLVNQAEPNSNNTDSIGASVKNSAGKKNVKVLDENAPDVLAIQLQKEKQARQNQRQEQANEKAVALKIEKAKRREAAKKERQVKLAEAARIKAENSNTAFLEDELYKQRDEKRKSETPMSLVSTPPTPQCVSSRHSAFKAAVKPVVEVAPPLKPIIMPSKAWPALVDIGEVEDENEKTQSSLISPPIPSPPPRDDNARSMLDDIITNASGPYIGSPDEFIYNLRKELDFSTAEEFVEIIEECLDVLALMKSGKKQTHIPEKQYTPT